MGKKRSAVKEWKRGRDIAIKLEMPFEIARAHYEIGRFADYKRNRRMKHLKQALTIFQNLKCKHFISATRCELGINSVSDSKMYFSRTISISSDKGRRNDSIKFQRKSWKSLRSIA